MGRFSTNFSHEEKFEPEGHVVSGRLAEFRLMKLTRAVCGDALVLEGIRLPDPDEGGRREIDMVIATKDEILFVEQKHWSGSFTITEEGRFSKRERTVELYYTRILLLGHAERVTYYALCMRKELVNQRPRVRSF